MSFPGRGTYISRDMSFPGGGTHVTRDMSCPGGGTHVTIDMSFLSFFFLALCVGQQPDQLHKYTITTFT